MSTQDRRDERFNAKQELWCEGQEEGAQTRNISRSGMFVVAEKPRAVGEQFTVAFEGDEGAVELKMEVMWSGAVKDGGQAGMGLRIVAFDKGEDAYERFVSRHLESQAAQEGDAKPSGSGDK